MKIRVVGIRNPGDLANERVVLELLENADIGNFISFFSIDLGGDVIAAKLLHPLWLPNKKLAAGDRVVIYSRGGSERIKQTETGKTILFVYRGLENAVCTEENIRASLIEVSGWETSDDIIS